MSAVIQYLLKAFKHAADGALAFSNFMLEILSYGLRFFSNVTKTFLNNVIQNSLFLAEKAFSATLHFFHQGSLVIHQVTSKIITATSIMLLKSIDTIQRIIRKSFDNMSYFAGLPVQFFKNSIEAALKTINYLGQASFNAISSSGASCLYLFNTMLNGFFAGLSNINTHIGLMAAAITSIITQFISRAFRSVFEIFQFLKNTLHEAAQLLTQAGAWIIFKSLDGINNILDATSELLSTLIQGLRSFGRLVIEIPKLLGQHVLSAYTLVNNLLSNLFVALLEREWALAAAIQRTIMNFFIIIKNICISAGNALAESAQWILFDIPQHILTMLQTTLNALNSFVSSLFSAVIPRLQTAHVVTRTALSGTAGFLFFEIPRGTLQTGSYVFYKVIHGLSYVGSFFSEAFNTTLFYFKNFLGQIKNTVAKSAQIIFIDAPQSIYSNINYFFNATSTTVLAVYQLFKNIVLITGNFIFSSAPKFLWDSTSSILGSIATHAWDLISPTINASQKIAHKVFIDLPLSTLTSTKNLLSYSTAKILQAYNVLSINFLSMLNVIFLTIPQFLWANIFGALSLTARNLWSGILLLGSKTQNASFFVTDYATKIGRYIFIVVPQNIWGGITLASAACAGITLTIYNELKNLTVKTGSFIFLTIPMTLWSGILRATKSAGSGLKATHSVVAPKLQTAHTVTTKALSGAAGFVLLEVPQSLFHYVKCGLGIFKDILTSIYSGIKTTFFWLGWGIFIQVPRAIFIFTTFVTSTIFSLISSALSHVKKVVQWTALLVIAFIKTMNKGLQFIGAGSRIILDGILGIPRGIAFIFIEIVNMTIFICLSLHSLLRKAVDGICYLATTPLRALNAFFDIVIAKLHTLHIHTIATIYAQRSAIQNHAFLGTSIYLMIVLFATYNTHHNAPISNIAQTQKNIHVHAIPVNVDIEIHKLQPSKEGFGCIDIEGILTYFYNTGTEPAHSIDNFTIKNAVHHSIKKLGSTVDSNHITTTRHAITATLSPALSNASTFPFSGSQSSFTIQNHSLSSREIHYAAPHKFLSSGNGTLLGLQKILMEPGESSLHARSESALMPELTITLEYQRWESYVILGLYIMLFAIIVLAIASILIPAQSIRLTVSGASFCILGIAWVACYFAGMLTNINHLMITLLLGLALSAIIVALNASNSAQSLMPQDNEYYQNGKREGQTRWILLLLSTLALVLTMLIKL